jgi:ferrochelatase
MLDKKTAVVLFNLGAPTSLDLVEKFLFNLFNDKAIIGLPNPFRFLLAKFISKKRAPKSRKIYEAIGGKSPLLEITSSQADNLERQLSFFGNFKVFVSMRYSSPTSSEIFNKIFEYAPQKIILLPLYPQFSTTTSESSLEDFINKFTFLQRKKEEKIELRTVCCYPIEEDFIKSHADLIQQTLAKHYKKELHQFRLLFSAHGLPQKIVDKGDPYVFQVNQSTNAIIENLAQDLSVEKKTIDFQVCYQSKVGPTKWTSPSLDLAIRKAVLDKKIPVIVPIAFVSDHSETLVELDIDYKKMAEDLKAIDYLRVPSLNNNQYFISSLVKICRKINEAENENSNQCWSGLEQKRICPKSLKRCINPNFCSND